MIQLFACDYSTRFLLIITGGNSTETNVFNPVKEKKNKFSSFNSPRLPEKVQSTQGSPSNSIKQPKVGCRLTLYYKVVNVPGVIRIADEASAT